MDIEVVEKHSGGCSAVVENSIYSPKCAYVRTGKDSGTGVWLTPEGTKGLFLALRRIIEGGKADKE